MPAEDESIVTCTLYCHVVEELHDIQYNIHSIILCCIHNWIQRTLLFKIHFMLHLPLLHLVYGWEDCIEINNINK